jgi:transcriptional regulator GlxA family with amidase domain
MPSAKKENRMARKMARITEPDLRDKAVAVRFKVAALARACGVNPRTLQRFFVTELKVQPHLWLTREKMEFVRRGLQKGEQIKALAVDAGYAHQTNLTRSYRRLYRKRPSDR